MNEDSINQKAENQGSNAGGDTGYRTKDEQGFEKPRRPIAKIIVPILVVAVIFGIWAYKNLPLGSATGEEELSEFALDATEDFDLEQILSYGLPVMIDFGADYCAPCREMEPILEKVNKDYRGRAVIKFVAVQKNLQAAGEFGLRVVPPQIFFDSKGQPYVYHEGFLPEEEIVRILEEIGVE